MLRAVACAVDNVVGDLVDAGLMWVHGVAADNHAGGEVTVHIVGCLHPRICVGGAGLVEDLGRACSRCGRRLRE